MSNKKELTPKQLIEKFKKGIEEVARIIEVEPFEVSRDVYTRVTVDNDLDRLNKKLLNDLGGFSHLMRIHFPKPEKTKEEIIVEEKLRLETQYIDYVIDIGITPSLSIIKSWGFTLKFIKDYYGNMRKLYDYMAKENPIVFQQLVNDSIFTEENFKKLKNQVKKHKRFIVTTAVSGKEVDELALKAMQTFCKNEDAMILIQPCEDVASRNSVFDYELDRRLRDCGFVYKDLYLNSNFYLSSITVSAKQINPLTGLDRLAQSKGSTILASPKQYLKFVPNSNLKLPHALMTTGAVTISDYSTDKSMSKRTSYLAEFDHIVGAVIIEIEDKDTFHFRQIQFDHDGSFYDFGWKYSPDGSVTPMETLIENGENTPKCVFGDTHAGSHDKEIDQVLAEITDYVCADEIIVHDLFDNRFNNHHDVGKPVTRAKLAMQKKTKMMTEGEITANWLNNWTQKVNRVTIVKSNHDEALERYIDEGRWKDDPENLYDACLLVRKRMEGKDPLRYLVETMVGLSEPEKINWLSRDEDYMIYGIECGSHGDKGGNGSRGSLQGIEKSYHKATVGHSHTAGILRNVYQVGTSTKLKLGYNTGPSSWTNTMCIHYPNGQRQLINMFRNKKGKVTYKLWD